MSPLQSRARVAIATWTVLAIALVTARALASDDPAAGSLSVWRLGGYVGGAVNSPAGDSWGETPDRDHLFLGLRGVTGVVRVGRVGLAYAPEIVPALIVSNNPKYETVTRRVGPELVEEQVENGRGPVYGFAIEPMGLELDFELLEHWSLYGAGGVGCVWFTRDVPVANSRAFNITFEIGAGMLWRYQPKRYVFFGYKFHHLSNAYSAEENPGLDGNVFYLGWQQSFRVRS